MAGKNITMRIDESLKCQLQELLSELGMDITTFFTLAAKQAVREQALPFQPKLSSQHYNMKAYKIATENTKYNEKGKAIIAKDDDWKEETEWDEIFKEMKKERQN